MRTEEDASAVLSVLLLADKNFAPKLDYLEDDADKVRIENLRANVSQGGDFNVAREVLQAALTCMTDDVICLQALRQSVGPLGLNVKVMAEACRTYHRVWRHLGKAIPSVVSSQLADNILAKAFDVADYRGIVPGQYPEVQYLSRATGRVICLGDDALHMRTMHDRPPRSIIYLQLKNAYNTTHAGFEATCYQSFVGNTVPWCPSCDVAVQTSEHMQYSMQAPSPVFSVFSYKGA